MSAIRSLIEAHLAAVRAFTYAGDNDEDRARATRNEAGVLNALIAEPTRSVETTQAKARYLLDGNPDAVGYLCGNEDMMRAFLGSFIHADPALYAIQSHKTARERLMKLDSTDHGYEAADSVELLAWRRLVETVPTTLDGVQRFAEHVAAHPDLNALSASDGPAQALRSIATALANLGGSAR